MTLNLVARNVAMKHLWVESLRYLLEKSKIAPLGEIKDLKVLGNFKGWDVLFTDQIGEVLEEVEPKALEQGILKARKLLEDLRFRVSYIVLRELTF